MDENDAGPMTRELWNAVRKTMFYVSYGEIEGNRVPNVAELLWIRGLIDASIHEIQHVQSSRRCSD